jgi:phospholipid/cholesterol/gamma-HCH transport system substrate-binding protein
MSRTSPTIIGAFVIGSLALIVAAVLFFGSGAFREKRLNAVSFFNGSVLGLRVGAPVTFRGVPIGEVKSLGVRVVPNSGELVQVNMELVPGMVTVYGAQPVREQAGVPELVQQGLTAQLVKQSFVTGLLGVELAFRPGAQTSRVGETQVPEVPTVPGDLEALTKQLQTVDIAATLDMLQRTLASLNTLLSSPDVARAVHDLPEITSTLKTTLVTINREASAISRTGRGALTDTASALQHTLASIDTLATTMKSETTSAFGAMRGTLRNADTALDDAHALLDPRGETMLQVQRAVEDLAAAAARVRNLTERVDRDPTILVRGR